MKTTTTTTERSGKVTASLVSVAGLIFVWAIVWANFPSKDELLSAQSGASSVEATRAPALDLTIPGVSSQPTANSDRTGRAASVTTLGGLSVPRDGRAQKITEVKCDAEVQQYCPDSLAGEDRRRCVMQRFKRLALPCQQIMQQRLVRWKEAEGYQLSCVID
ncbi:MAG: hypothetical protein HC801_04210, partial [Nitrospira sp.]|nr:hypothetical protein [Nitrospira sp.]